MMQHWLSDICTIRSGLNYLYLIIELHKTKNNKLKQNISRF